MTIISQTGLLPQSTQTAEAIEAGTMTWADIPTIATAATATFSDGSILVLRPSDNQVVAWDDINDYNAYTGTIFNIATK